jgi:hypothetical protein
MTARTFLAGILGAIAMFIWSWLAHDILPLGKIGISQIPNEATVAAAMQTNIGDKDGLYFFPGAGLSPNATRQEQNEAMKHMAETLSKNPSGLLVYHPPGRPFTFGKLLGVEFATELLQSLLAVFLLSQTRLAGFGARVGFISVAGILATIATNVSYWNWYGFPCIYTASYMFIQFVGFICVGLVAAFVLKKKDPPAADR